MYKPGTLCPISGTYRAYTKTGEWTHSAKRVKKGDPFPPTPCAECGYIFEDYV